MNANNINQFLNTKQMPSYMHTKTRHRCIKYGNIPKTEGGQIHHSFVTVLWSPWI